MDGIKSSIRLHNLRKYTTYFVWIWASTSVGTGPTSSKHTFSTAEDGGCISSFHCAAVVPPPSPPPPPGLGVGDSHMKSSGILVGKCELNPKRRAIWAWLELYVTSRKGAPARRPDTRYRRISSLRKEIRAFLLSLLLRVHPKRTMTAKDCGVSSS